MLLIALAGPSPGLDLLPGPPHLAPPPRIRPRLSIYAGRVIDLEPDHVTIRHLDPSVNRGVDGYDWTGTVWTYNGHQPLSVWEPDSPRGRRWVRKLVLARDYFIETDFWGRIRTVRRGDEPPRRFWVGAELEDGSYRTTMGAKFTYRLKDVRVGDEVLLWMEHGRHYTDLCANICIRRRPGGRVPQAPGEEPGEERPHHERMQAAQDWEEHGMPFPAKFRSSHEEMLEAIRAGHTAPPPRVAKPRQPANP